jgi:hypothetical protein
MTSYHVWGKPIVKSFTKGCCGLVVAPSLNIGEVVRSSPVRADRLKPKTLK